MIADQRNQRSPFLRALTSAVVWRRAAPIGLGAGFIQAIANQGDHWLHHEFTTTVIIKTILSPLISLTVALLSAASAQSAAASNSPSSIPHPKST
jgi:hypothetical protein